MLVLGRRRNQEIVIDGQIVVKVLGIRGGTVRLGIEAPRSVSIERAEVRDRLASEAAVEYGGETAEVDPFLCGR